MPPKRRNIGPLRTAIDRQGRGSVPARFFLGGVDGGCNRICSGRPACRPGRGFSRDPSAGGHIGPPLRKTGRFPQPPGPAAHSGASASAGARKWVGIAAEIIPKGAINLGQSLSHGEAVTAPFAQGSLGTGDADCRVGPLGLLAMTMVFCHSEERSDVGIRPFYDGRGFGPPYLGHGLRRPNFVPKFGASVIGIGPYGWLQRAATTTRAAL